MGMQSKRVNRFIGIVVIAVGAMSAAHLANADDAPAGAAEGITPAPTSVWDTRVHDALRRESSAKGAEQEQAVRDLVRLYESLEKAKGIDREERAELRRLVRNRLIRSGDRISKQVEKARKKPAAAQGPSVAQVSSAAEANHAVAGALANADGRPSRSAGSPNSAPAAAGGQGGQQMPDHGRELVELIQHTIAPQSWDINGGNGTIIYFAPRQAIVVRQTAEVRGDLGDVLQGLRN